jgi:NAD+ diphosphatase
MEEVGIVVDDIQYQGSQPWPFPGQLMLGFTAKWVSGEICVDPEEIDDAVWCSGDNLPSIPPSFSIAGQLINAFLSTQRLL